jgi:peroxiredoxin
MGLVRLLISLSLLGSGPVKLGEPAPAFRVRLANGHVVTLADFGGRVEVVLLFD